MVFPTPTPCLTQRWQQIPGCGFLCLWNQRPLLLSFFFLQRLPPSLSSTECLAYLFLCHCFAFALSNKVTITLIPMIPNATYFIYTYHQFTLLPLSLVLPMSFSFSFWLGKVFNNIHYYWYGCDLVRTYPWPDTAQDCKAFDLQNDSEINIIYFILHKKNLWTQNIIT